MSALFERGGCRLQDRLVDGRLRVQGHEADNIFAARRGPHKTSGAHHGGPYSACFISSRSLLPGWMPLLLGQRTASGVRLSLHILNSACPSAKDQVQPFWWNRAGGSPQKLSKPPPPIFQFRNDPWL